MKNKRIKFDKKSIGARLCAHFIFFTLFLVGILWLLQILFLVNYYQSMKIQSIKEISDELVESYKKGNFEKSIDEMALSSDIFIQIEAGNTIFFAPSRDSRRAPGYVFLDEMEQVRGLLFKKTIMTKDNDSATLIIDEKNGSGSKKVLAYARFLSAEKGREVVLYIFSPLYPVDSTISILRTQLVYVSIISVIIAFLLSIFLSSRISKPIREITSEASNLAKGEFNFEPSTKHYTQIRHLAETLSKAAFDLKKSEKMQKDVLANISHDLRTPLTMIKSYAEMLKDLSWENPEKREKHLKVIIDESDRLEMLVSEIIELSAIQSGNQELVCEKFNLNELIIETLKRKEILLGKDNYHFELQAASEAEIFADRSKIDRVLNNLIDNAIKYVGEDRRVILRVFKYGSKVRVEVSDNGAGIAQEEQAMIWERYGKSSENHARKVKGTGLGLAIVKEIIKAHGGECGVESELGKGSTFYFILRS